MAADNDSKPLVWQSKALEHHCPICKRPGTHPRARDCIDQQHVEPCENFHQTLFRKGTSGKCYTCKKEWDLHTNHHRAILDIILSIVKSTEAEEIRARLPKHNGRTHIPTKITSKVKAKSGMKSPLTVWVLHEMLHPSAQTEQQQIAVPSKRIMDVLTALSFWVGQNLSHNTNFHSLYEHIKADLEIESSRIQRRNQMRDGYHLYFSGRTFQEHLQTLTPKDLGDSVAENSRTSAGDRANKPGPSSRRIEVLEAGAIETLKANTTLPDGTQKASVASLSAEASDIDVAGLILDDNSGSENRVEPRRNTTEDAALCAEDFQPGLDDDDDEDVAADPASSTPQKGTKNSRKKRRQKENRARRKEENQILAARREVEAFDILMRRREMEHITCYLSIDEYKKMDQLRNDFFSLTYGELVERFSSVSPKFLDMPLFFGQLMDPEHNPAHAKKLADIREQAAKSTSGKELHFWYALIAIDGWLCLWHIDEQARRLSEDRDKYKRFLEGMSLIFDAYYCWHHGQNLPQFRDARFEFGRYRYRAPEDHWWFRIQTSGHSLTRLGQDDACNCSIAFLRRRIETARIALEFQEIVGKLERPVQAVRWAMLW
ncbi:hypothetical protein K461DRAFT_293973 [Myriangium duriaei CBS 260.36]|uniref:Uncharacterized protein n=1 Tax=Myriangium duriaei CBS 260.36 TaxID=1168546 RepID=A0A9P4J4K2_9PEZI|nr:hypothetical protein K461DRAFT_293973 [Myriangium duriaei CBS 260.36]